MACENKPKCGILVINSSNVYFSYSTALKCHGTSDYKGLNGFFIIRSVHTIYYFSKFITYYITNIQLKIKQNSVKIRSTKIFFSYSIPIGLLKFIKYIRFGVFIKLCVKHNYLDIIGSSKYYHCLEEF